MFPNLRIAFCHISGAPKSKWLHQKMTVEKQAYDHRNPGVNMESTLGIHQLCFALPCLLFLFCKVRKVRKVRELAKFAYFVYFAYTEESLMDCAFLRGGERARERERERR